MTHSPSPWTVRRSETLDRPEKYRPLEVQTRDGSTRIAMLPDGWTNDDHKQARLLAAAPVMADLLREWKLRAGTDPALANLSTETAILLGEIDGATYWTPDHYGLQDTN